MSEELCELCGGELEEDGFCLNCDEDDFEDECDFDFDFDDEDEDLDD